MKNLILFTAICFSLSAFGQSNKEDIDIIQSLYGKEKKVIVGDFIKLDESKKDAFWKIYDEYETKRKEFGKKRIALLERYANEYDKLDDATTSKLVKDITSLAVQNDKLISTYYAKLEKAVGSKPAAQFFQLESYFLSAIRVAIFESIPFIGELD
jgi:hypothetical protein